MFTPEAEILPSHRSETWTPSRLCPAPFPGSAGRGVEELHAGGPGRVVADGDLDSQQPQFSGLETSACHRVFATEIKQRCCCL